MHHRPPELEVWIVRHGETEANRAGIIQGQSESPLSELGTAQASLMADRLSAIEWWRIRCSDLGRCMQTARLLLTSPAAASDTIGAEAAAEQHTDGASSSAVGSSSDDTSTDSSGSITSASSTAGAMGAASGAAEAVMHVGRYRVELDPRVREMSAGVYEGLPRGTSYQEAVRAKAHQAGLTVQAFVDACGGPECVPVREDPSVRRHSCPRRG
jgi:broad specificity phosphatase PhoE